MSKIKTIKVYNAFSIIVTTDSEQEDLTKAYLDGDWTEIGRIISKNIERDIIQSDKNFRDTLNRVLGGAS